MLILLEAGVVFFSFTQAQASLGGASDTIQSDSTKLKASKAVTSSQVAASASSESYTVHEIQANSMVIKEFVSAGGVVFALTWEGARSPDLQVLLGNYHAAYKTAYDSIRTTRTHRGQDRRHVVINTDSLVVNRSGRTPHLKGVAYDPKLLPSGFDLEALK
jgi:hypothetical protein